MLILPEIPLIFHAGVDHTFNGSSYVCCQWVCNHWWGYFTSNWYIHKQDIYNQNCSTLFYHWVSHAYWHSFDKHQNLEGLSKEQVWGNILQLNTTFEPKMHCYKLFQPSLPLVTELSYKTTKQKQISLEIVWVSHSPAVKSRSKNLVIVAAQMRNWIRSQKILQQNHQQFYMFDTYASNQSF